MDKGRPRSALLPVPGDCLGRFSCYKGWKGVTFKASLYIGLRSVFTQITKYLNIYHLCRRIKETPEQRKCQISCILETVFQEPLNNAAPVRCASQHPTLFSHQPCLHWTDSPGRWLCLMLGSFSVLRKVWGQCSPLKICTLPVFSHQGFFLVSTPDFFLNWLAFGPWALSLPFLQGPGVSVLGQEGHGLGHRGPGAETGRYHLLIVQTQASLHCWPGGAYWSLPTHQWCRGVCLEKRATRADELWGDQLVKQPDPDWGNRDGVD